MIHGRVFGSVRSQIEDGARRAGLPFRYVRSPRHVLRDLKTWRGYLVPRRNYRAILVSSIRCCCHRNTCSSLLSGGAVAKQTKRSESAHLACLDGRGGGSILGLAAGMVILATPPCIDFYPVCCFPHSVRPKRLSETDSSRRAIPATGGVSFHWVNLHTRPLCSLGLFNARMMTTGSYPLHRNLSKFLLMDASYAASLGFL